MIKSAKNFTAQVLLLDTHTPALFRHILLRTLLHENMIVDCIFVSHHALSQWCWFFSEFDPGAEFVELQSRLLCSLCRNPFNVLSFVLQLNLRYTIALFLFPRVLLLIFKHHFIATFRAPVYNLFDSVSLNAVTFIKAFDSRFRHVLCVEVPLNETGHLALFHLLAACTEGPDLLELAPVWSDVWLELRFVPHARVEEIRDVGALWIGLN